MSFAKKAIYLEMVYWVAIVIILFKLRRKQKLLKPVIIIVYIGLEHIVILIFTFENV